MRSSLAVFLILCSGIAMSQNPFKAIEKSDLAKFQKYLDKGGDINAKYEVQNELTDDSYEVNLLDHAVRWECEDVVKLIIDQKEKIEDFDLVLSEAFIYSLSVGNDTISNLLFEQKPIDKGTCSVCHGNNALMVASYYGREEWYFKLKDKSDLLYLNNLGSSLLHTAATGPSQKILEDVLTISQLDINRSTSDGLTPLDCAAFNEDNPAAFKTLLEHGADHKKAWNLLYWWCMYDFDLTDEMIKDRKEDVWMIDEEGENCIMLLSYFYVQMQDSDPGIFEKKLRTIISLMLHGNQNQSNLEFVEQFYQDGITMNILNAMLYIEDFNNETPFYPTYLEFLAMLCDKAEFCPVYKKEYKTACKIYGEEKVKGWYEQYGLPVE